MKICIISFDSTYFDHNIKLELERRSIDVNHIDASKFKFKYKSVFDRININLNNKEYKKNKKREALEEYILKKITAIGKQEIILFIRPDKISRVTHLEIKKQTKTYISYIYDSCKRFPIDHLLNGVFDEIFSFDLVDSKKYNFTFIPNYIYMEKRESDLSKLNNNIFMVISIDERFNFLNKLANYLSSQNISYKFIAVGKKLPEKTNKNIVFSKRTLLPCDLKDDLEHSKIFLDLIRKDHNGLSFRIFEAIAMQRKIITTNKTIKNYDFYNPNNILILDSDTDINISNDFLATPYEPLSEAIYCKYTIQNWVNTVFKIN
ncbi:hypothetical protein ACFSX9_04810 [Flavobacterium ardleyense]|uniref:Lipopolysaccharide core biosynthesis protein rfaS n=1 Tax=Flavobacterium ardleyense TaxID=2038737 RepID=A0ABW5Z6H1_9FLAO